MQVPYASSESGALKKEWAELRHLKQVEVRSVWVQQLKVRTMTLVLSVVRSHEKVLVRTVIFRKIMLAAGWGRCCGVRLG